MIFHSLLACAIFHTDSCDKFNLSGPHVEYSGSVGMTIKNLAVKDIKEWRVTTSQVKYLLAGINGLSL